VHATAGSILIIGAGRTNDINNELVALIGAGDRNAVNLGTFPGNTITDNVDVKTALQELEGAVDTALQPGDNISTLTNDVGYITSAGAPVQSVAGKTGTVTLVKADVTDFSDGDYATAAQGALASTALQSGDNISNLTNDAGYITVAEVPESGIPEAPLDGNYYVRSSGAWVKLTDALSTLGVEFTDPVDGGNFTTGLGTAITNQIYDAGNFTDGTSAATNSNTIDGGLTTP
jgi:hypothetical protein